MSKFSSKEEYEKWRAEELKKLQEKRHAAGISPMPPGKGSEKGEGGEEAGSAVHAGAEPDKEGKPVIVPLTDDSAGTGKKRSPLIIVIVAGVAVLAALYMFGPGQESTVKQGKTAGGQSAVQPSGKKELASGGKGENAGIQQSEVKGEAVVILDGATETYTLKTGAFSETKFKEPKRATVQFQMPAEKHGNARMIEIILDATKIGQHYANGKAINDEMSRNARLNIGESTTKGYISSFKFIADGGQVFTPKDACIITITSPYTGARDGVFTGEVTGCIVHSAGIDKNISSVKFTMTGVSFN